MKTKHPILTEPWIFKLIPELEAERCGYCSHHTFIVVQKVAHYYTIHTHLKPSSSFAYIHKWMGRAGDPECLAAYDRLCIAPGYKQKPEIEKPTHWTEQKWDYDYDELIVSLLNPNVQTVPPAPAPMKVTLNPHPNTAIHMNHAPNDPLDWEPLTLDEDDYLDEE